MRWKAAMGTSVACCVVFRSMDCVRMSTFTVLTEPDSTERRSTATSLRVKLEKGSQLIIEDKALIAFDTGATLATTDDTFIQRWVRTFGGDSFTARTVTSEAEDGTVVEIGSGTTEPRAVIAIEIDSLNDRALTVSDGAWVAQTDGVESETVWKGVESIKARERGAMSYFTGQGLVFVEGQGTLIEKTLAEGESIVLGQARLTAYSDGVDITSENNAGRRLVTATGPGVVVYKTHAENI